MPQSTLRRPAALAIVVSGTLVVHHSRLDGQEGFRFRSRVELVNVTATVTDRSGRFVSGLRQSDSPSMRTISRSISRTSAPNACQ
jgi:hypothetical protein